MLRRPAAASVDFPPLISSRESLEALFSLQGFPSQLLSLAL